MTSGTEVGHLYYDSKDLLVYCNLCCFFYIKNPICASDSTPSWSVGVVSSMSFFPFHLMDAVVIGSEVNNQFLNSNVAPYLVAQSRKG